MGQMAARDYVDRLEDLYKEFSECYEYTGGKAKSLHYESVYHLLEQTPNFWEGYVKHKLEADCLGPMSDAILTGRAEDLNGDGDLDSGGDFYSAYLFHTRDTIRQSVRWPN